MYNQMYILHDKSNVYAVFLNFIKLYRNVVFTFI